MNDTPDYEPETELDADIGEAEGFTGEDDLAPLDAVIAERDQWKDRALRAVAESENIKRRAETQNNDARAYAIQKFARDLLVVADNLERAIQAAPKDADGAAAGLVSGLELTQKALFSAFEANNLKRVAPEPGEVFDPHLHQAMMEQPSDTVQGGQVIQTLQAGYALFGRTVRPAMVVVAAKGSGAAAGNAAYQAAARTGGNFDGQA
ncbi:nucleotide exchange factor GrpE [Brevundimonas sp. FT23042]|uniref:nucleotide exchange factor GrpE n=1 Tax=Brevundimonas sp. FT23042 TaxID=3393749 RepID=UPI003B586988